jgi:SpoIID/LytB domain protein
MAAEEVGLKGERYPYQPINCEACRRNAPTWTRRLAASAWQSRNESQRLQINRRVGSRTLPSNHYTIRQDGEDVIVEGRGDGHGVGVCQKGIIDMARKGGDFRALLTRYLPQTRSAANVQ